jgi:hypothetical protein
MTDAHPQFNPWFQHTTQDGEDTLQADWKQEGPPPTKYVWKDGDFIPPLQFLSESESA